jgi:hypothetical protein
MKEIEEYWRNRKASHFHRLEEFIVLKCPHYSYLQFQYNPFQYTNDYIHITRKKEPKIKDLEISLVKEVKELYN